MTDLHQPKSRAVGLGEAKIIDAAMALVIEGGTAALTMRRLAARLQVSPMALYRHVPDKRTLEAMLAQRISKSYYGDIVIPEGLAWQEMIRLAAQARFELYQDHPEVARFGTLVLATEWNLSLTDRLLSALLAEGLPERMVIRALRLCQLTMLGACAEIEQPRREAEPAQWPDFGPNLGDYPAFARLHDLTVPADMDPRTTIELFIQLIELLIASMRILSTNLAIDEGGHVSA